MVGDLTAGGSGDSRQPNPLRHPRSISLCWALVPRSLEIADRARSPRDGFDADPRAHIVGTNGG
jgi:hypothetical protein